MKKRYLIILILLSFFIMPIVDAEVERINTTDVQFRKSPSSSSTSYGSIPNNTEITILNKNAGIGGGCSDNWYQVEYNNITGYVCSTYIGLRFTYGIPWTTPKKAIIGGGQFIGEDYVLIGQNTSYLMKFNVNPENPSRVNNHQYMANIRDPVSKASRTYNAREKNNLLNQAYNFYIPEFTNMPKSTYDSKYWNTNRNTANVQDDAFENSIKDFADSYKPYLRYLHTQFSLWTFTVIKTELDFNYIAEEQQKVGLIEKGSGQCVSGDTRSWCKPTLDATKFFLDPRNFLSLQSIFMFENLKYSEAYTEAVVQTVITGTFMEGKSILDNQTYASIFVEAGQKSNVSPLYLASFVIQEIGSSKTPTLTTSGEAFEYEGYYYSGLYNFFNIGAYDSEANPAKAGLIFANGGKGTNNGNVTNNNIFYSLLKVSVINNYIKGYSLGTNVKSVKDLVGSSYNIIIKNSSGNEKGNNDLLATGDIISISNGETAGTYTYVMKGDLNGDGGINSADLLRLRQHLLGINKLNGAYLSSALVSSGTEINSADLLKIRQHLLGLTKIEQ